MFIRFVVRMADAAADDFTRARICMRVSVVEEKKVERANK